MKLNRLALLTALLIFAAGALPGWTGQMILLLSGNIDPETAPRAIAKGPEPDYYIVQFTGPIIEEWKEQAAQTGAELLDYLPEFAFVAKADADSLEKIQGLSFVRWVGDFRPEFKVSPALVQAKGRVAVNVQGFRGEPLAALTRAVAGVGGDVLAALEHRRSIVRAEVPAEAIAALSQVREIAWIEPYTEPRLWNQAARGITGVTTVWQDVGLYGNGQIVAVADTGLDNGANDSTMSGDFRGRILKAYTPRDLTGRPRRHAWSDIHSHGTHVCGSVLGSGQLSGSNPATRNYGSSFAGVAPEALLVIQALMDTNGSLVTPSNLNNLFGPTYGDGARIHTNSWGYVDLYGVYHSSSQQVDEFSWNNKNMLILFSAGNDGVDANSDGVVDLNAISPPATAKNCITVGATENLMPSRNFTYGNVWPADYPVNPIYSDGVASNSSGMAAFSSRGPTNDGRMKPDIVAPGTSIISSRTHVSNPMSTLWGVYNSDYLYSGGTSMSTPITAGAAVLMREFLMGARGFSNPSAALLKAALMNSAADIYPGQYGTGAAKEIPSLRPNVVQGWGRLDVRNAVTPPAPSSLDFVDAAALSTGGSRDHTVTIHNASVPFKVTLVWTDYQGSTQVSKQLVNDLDLIVIAPGGTQFRGNGTIDRTNNVETVDIASPAAGNYTVRVSAFNVPNGPQPYALAVMGGLEADALAVASVSAAKLEQDGTLISMIGQIVTAGTEVFGDHFYIEDADRTSGIKVAFTGGAVPTAGMVNLTGQLATVGGERQITATSVTVVSTGNTVPSPLGIRNSDIGGIGLGTRLGAPNTGLLIRTWGQVISWGTNDIVIDDGYGPLTVRTGSLPKPAVESYVSITGISSVASDQPLVKARFATDIVPH